jgi:hypothetical protein
MKKQVQPQRGTKMHKEAEELLIVGRKCITGGRSDFLGLNRSALSASSAVKLFSVSACFFVSSWELGVRVHFLSFIGSRCCFLSDGVSSFVAGF